MTDPTTHAPGDLDLAFVLPPNPEAWDRVMQHERAAVRALFQARGLAGHSVFATMFAATIEAALFARVVFRPELRPDLRDVMIGIINDTFDGITHDGVTPHE